MQPIQPKRIDDKYSEKVIDDESMELPGKPDDQSRNLTKGSDKKLFNGRIGYNSYPNEVSAKKVRSKRCSATPSRSTHTHTHI